MADAFKVAPLSPSAGSVVDSTEAAQYQEALNQSMRALEQRMTPQTNLFNIAAGFLKPTRGGSFGESLGNVNEAMGKEQERVQQETVPIAQMRAQLAGQKYEMAQRGKAMESLNAMLGGSPVITKDDLPAVAKSTGLALDDPKLAEFVGQPKAAFMSGTGESVVGVTAQPVINKNELNQALIASGGNPTAAMKMLFERQTKWGEPSQLQKDLKYATDPSTPPAVAKIVMDKVSSEAQRLGFDIFKFASESGVKMPGGATPAPATPSAVTPQAKTTPQTTPSPALNKYGMTEEDEKYIVRNPDGSVKDIIAREPDAAQRPSIQGQPIETKGGETSSEYLYPDNTPVIIPASVPPAKRYDYVKDRLAEYQQNVEKAETNTGKVYEKKLEGIATIDPAILKKQNTDFVEAKQIINNEQLKPYMGQMFKQGFVPGMMTALNNGIKVGPWSASIDSYAIWLNSLPQEVQTEFKRLDQILGGAYMAAVSAKPFGAAPSNFEDLQMKNTMATSKDPYKIINNFLNEQTITNTHLADMRGRFDAFNTTKAKNVQPYGFFGTPSYKESMDLYNKDYKAYKTLGAR